MANQVFTSLEDDTLDELDNYAEHYGISRSAAIRYAVLELLRKERREPGVSRSAVERSS